jgi:type IV pilus assembly protein PilY1
MKRTLLALAVAAAMTAAILLPVRLLADAASCSITVSSYADAILNPPKGEDTEFFVSTGGVPNLMFVLDTSGSMQRLAPDGASAGWGSFEAPGNATQGAGYGCTNGWANTRVFYSPCGTTTLEGSPYNPSPGNAPPDFAQAKDASGKYCPYMSSGNQPPGTDKPGFDPDFYPQFFAPARIYHDTVLSPVSSSDGWSDTSTSPESEADYTTFCNRWSSNATKKAKCVSCMRDQGYFFDGSYQTWGGNPSCKQTADCDRHGYGTCIHDTTGLEYNGGAAGVAHCKIPHVWFTGNFLNFNPPKFVMARKVLKDVLQSVRKIRLGLSTFDSSGPQEPLNPGCNMLGSPSNFDSNRTSIKNAINNTSKVNFSGGTPLAETLLHVGQYYASSSLTWFNNTYSSNSWAEKSGQNKSYCYQCQASTALVISDGAPSTDGTIPGTDFAANGATQAAADAANAVAGMAGWNIRGIACVIDGVDYCNSWAEQADTTLGSGTCLGQEASGGCDDSNNPVQAYVPKVAWYLHNFDLRPNGETASDGQKMTGKQTLTTYTIGLGTRDAASQILADTAKAGGGLYNGGTGADVVDAKSLRDAILKVLEDVTTRSVSFGTASLSTLQVAASQGVLVPRFEPARTAHWDGHLYSFSLFSEFSSGTCSIPASGASGPANGDYDCDGKCTSVFLQDSDGDFIQEDATGAFKKNVPRNRAACSPTNRCTTACAKIDDATVDAKPFWDAGSRLAPKKSGAVNPQFDSSKTWNRRAIYTVIDSNGDGKLTAADTLLDLRTVDPATLVPYLNIVGNRYCSKIAMRLTSAGNTAGATIDSQVATGTYTACAKAILDYVRGADIFNERKGDASPDDCRGFPGTYCTRSYQLGDIFHSSPIEVWPPLPSDGFLCIRGLHSQCLPSLFSTSIPNPADPSGTNATAYDDYAKHARYKHRNKFTVVGANDGLLHAFVTGTWIPKDDPKADDPKTPADESKAPFEGRYDEGTGKEIWAFIPPDLLPKLRLLTEPTHQFYVDGTPMVRDVWIDGGAANKVGGSTSANGIRAGNEFHTVAVVGERRGGTHYFALDVTDAGDDLDAKPRFLWLYPQPNDPEELSFGETYVDFLPKPPPIGPVRIDAGAPPCTGNRQEYGASTGTRCFEERWIAFLSGGFDPQYTKGRGVHMVDIATGDEIFDFSQASVTGSAFSASAGACTTNSDPRCHLNYPVAATVGMMMWGKQSKFLSAASVDGYFDTATFGDTGGQLWTLRFNDPAILDPVTKKATNWFGARVFQNGLTGSTPACGLDYCGGQPIFYITSNVPLAANGMYRTLTGTGDRFNLLDPVGGTCGPDNIRACMLKGCTVKLDDGAGGAGAVYGADLLGTQSYHMDHPALCSGLAPATYTWTGTASGATCSTLTSRIDNLSISCPSTKTCSGTAEATRKKTSVTCTAGNCDESAGNESGIPIDTKGNPDKRNWFFSIQVFEDTGARIPFKTAAEALAYDQARLKETDLVNINLHDQSPATNPTATPDGRGWSYFYDHGEPSATTPWDIIINGAGYHIYRTDERTASVSAVAGSCAFWNTMQVGVPSGSFDATTECPINSPCKAGKAQTSYLYGASPGTGDLCMYIDNALARQQKNETLVPPNMGKLVAYVNSGQVSFGLTSVRVPQGGSNIALGKVQDLASQMQWLPVDKRLHACRHAPWKDAAGNVLPGPSPDACLK